MPQNTNRAEASREAITRVDEIALSRHLTRDEVLRALRSSAVMDEIVRFAQIFRSPRGITPEEEIERRR